jgi:hypothetical protein
VSDVQQFCDVDRMKSRFVCLVALSTICCGVVEAAPPRIIAALGIVGLNGGSRWATVR